MTTKRQILINNPNHVQRNRLERTSCHNADNREQIHKAFFGGTAGYFDSRATVGQTDFHAGFSG
jgi:hypothetical protein